MDHRSINYTQSERREHLKGGPGAPSLAFPSHASNQILHIIDTQLDVETYILILALRRWKLEDLESHTILGYTVSSRPTWAT